MKDRIRKLLDDLKSLIEHDTYSLTRDDISALVQKIDCLKEEILETYKNKSID